MSPEERTELIAGMKAVFLTRKEMDARFRQVEQKVDGEPRPPAKHHPER